MPRSQPVSPSTPPRSRAARPRARATSGLRLASVVLGGALAVAGCKSRAFNQPASAASGPRTRPPANPEAPDEYARSLARLMRGDGAYLCNALLVGTRTLLVSAACGDLARRSPGGVRMELSSPPPAKPTSKPDPALAPAADPALAPTTEDGESGNTVVARPLRASIARERPKGPTHCVAGLDFFTFLDDLPAAAEGAQPAHSPAALDATSPVGGESVVVASWGLPGVTMGAGRFRVRREGRARFSSAEPLPLGPTDGGAVVFAAGPADTAPREGKGDRADFWDRLAARSPSTPILRARGLNEGPSRSGFLDLADCRPWVSAVLDRLEPESAPGGVEVEPEFE